MKKLLSLLSVLTIGGTALPTAVAASSYQKQEKFNSKINFSQTNNLKRLARNKRDPGDKNEFVITDKIYASFTPNLWEEIIQEWYFSNNNLKEFQKKFKEKFKDYRDNKHSFSEWWISEKANGYLDIFSKELWNNWNIIISDWRKSNKLYRIRIVTELNGKFVSVNIRNDDTLYHGNEYLNKQILNEIVLNTKLGEINYINSKNILDVIKQKNPDVDISYLSVKNITINSANITVTSIGKYLLNTQVNVFYFQKLQLGQINDNSDIVILNELNYLNPDLDISKLEIINKTNNSAIIKEKNSFNNENITNVKYSINNELNKVVNLDELIKKAIFFKFRDENSNLKFKEIKYIDTNNLNFSNVEGTKKTKLLISIDYKYPCSDKEVINRTSNPKLFYVPGCEYNSKSELIFQIRKGMIKNQEKNQENIWTLNSDDENKLIEFTYLNNKDVEIINTLSNDFIFSNLSEQKQEMILNMFREPDSRFELNPNEKLITNYSVRINKSEVILNLKQKITGIINAKIIDNNNEEQIITLSIKEAMQILQRYNLLPDEIVINKYNSITFNGEAFLSLKTEGQLKTSINTFII